MGKNTNPAGDPTTAPSTPTTSTPDPAPSFDPAAVAAAVVAIDGPTADAVAALLPTGPTKRAAGERNAVLAAVAIAAATDPAAVAALAVLADAVTIAASVSASRTVVAATPTDPADVLAAFASVVTFYATTTGADVPRGPLAAFVAAAAKVPTTPDAGPIVASVVGRRRGNASGGSQSTGTRQDRSGGRDLSRLAADTFAYRGCTARVAIDGDALAVTVRRDRANVGTFPSLSAAGRAAASADGATNPSVNGWVAWVTPDGRTADAVVRGVLAGQ